jgi:hypothetical protein
MGEAVRSFQRPRLEKEKDEESTSTKSKKAKKEDESRKTEDPPSRRGRARTLRQIQVNI